MDAAFTADGKADRKFGAFGGGLVQYHRGCGFRLCYRERVTFQNHHRIIGEKEKSNSIKEAFYAKQGKASGVALSRD